MRGGGGGGTRNLDHLAGIRQRSQCVEKDAEDIKNEVCPNSAT